MKTECGVVRFRIPFVERFERPADLCVQKYPARREYLCIDRLPYMVVREIEAVAGRVQHAAAYQLLHGFRRVMVRHHGGAPHQPKIELSPDHRCGVRDLARADGQSLAGDFR